MKKAMIAIGTIAVLVGGSLAIAILSPVGLVDAQEEDEQSEASPPGIQGERPRLLEEALAELVSEGVITQEQSDAVQERIRSKFEEHRGERPGGPGGPGFDRGASLEVAAEALGLTADEVKDALKSGSTLADLAGQQGVEVQALIDAIVADLTARIDEAVASGELDAERAEEIKAGMVDRVTDLVNNGRPSHPGGPGGPGGFEPPAGEEQED